MTIFSPEIILRHFVNSQNILWPIWGQNLMIAFELSYDKVMTCIRQKLMIIVMPLRCCTTLMFHNFINKYKIWNSLFINNTCNWRHHIMWVQQYVTVPPAMFATKPKQSVTIYGTQTVTIAMVTSHLWQIFKIMKDNFCEFTYDMS